MCPEIAIQSWRWRSLCDPLLQNINKKIDWPLRLVDEEQLGKLLDQSPNAVGLKVRLCVPPRE
eukprot:m.248444 g.248444  ORF g.248444 m.248444 type:complete len:63 (-) comp15728_c0_seq1:212-400(-)